VLGRFFAHRGREVWQAGAVTALGRIVSIALITAGLVVLADVGLTLAYREPVSSIYASIKQGEARDRLAELESHYPTAADRRALRGISGSRRRIALLAGRLARRSGDGDPIGRIEAPAMDGLDAVVVQGTGTASLQKGPGHYPQTAFPGQRGTVAIAGHRTTYLAPFRHIDDLERGDAIRLEMPYATFVYRVQKTRVVDPGDVGIVRPVGYDRLVLSACHPLYSAAHRFVAFARLRRVTAAGP
jgi:sortase A